MGWKVDSSRSSFKEKLDQEKLTTKLRMKEKQGEKLQIIWEA